MVMSGDELGDNYSYVPSDGRLNVGLGVACRSVGVSLAAEKPSDLCGNFGVAVANINAALSASGSRQAPVPGYDFSFGK